MILYLFHEKYLLNNYFLYLKYLEKLIKKYFPKFLAYTLLHFPFSFLNNNINKLNRY